MIVCVADEMTVGVISVVLEPRLRATTAAARLARSSPNAVTPALQFPTLRKVVHLGLPVGSQENRLARDSIRWLPRASLMCEPRISQELGGWGVRRTSPCRHELSSRGGGTATRKSPARG